MNKTKLIISSAYAAITSIVFVVVITIWAEFNAPLKDWLKNFSGHHWTSKSIFSLALYAAVTVLAYLLPFKYSESCLKKSLVSLFVFLILGVAALALFFTGHHFKIF